MFEFFDPFKSSVEEIETATVYLDLFVRTITDAALIHSFLKFILTEEFDRQVIINTLISRINSHPRVSPWDTSIFILHASTLFAFMCLSSIYCSLSPPPFLQLSLITMSLFKTMLELNCEDVMLELVFKWVCTTSNHFRTEFRGWFHWLLVIALRKQVAWLGMFFKFW